MDLLEKALRSQEKEKKPKKPVETPVKPVIIKPIKSKPTTPRKVITGDKDMNKSQLVDWFTKFIKENQDNFTTDWLRGTKLTFECVNEIRKK